MKKFCIKELFSVFLLIFIVNVSLLASDPLPSWNNTPIKLAIVSYVKTITDPKSPDFVPVSERVAVMDLDGTLMTEWPINFQRALAVRHLKHIAVQSPDLRQFQPFKSAYENDHFYYNHKNNHSEVFLTAFNKHSQEKYHDYVQNFLKTEKDPHWNVTYDNLLYKPGIELVKYLEANGFSIYICSTTEVECIRQLLSHAIKMSPSQIIGNEVVKEVSLKNGKVEFFFTDQFRQPENRSEQKCVYCDYRIGIKPIFGFGNSSGDSAFLQMVSSSKYKSLALILDHDDPLREIEYHEKSLLDDARRHNWEIISMKRDFKDVHIAPVRAKKRNLDISTYIK